MPADILSQDLAADPTFWVMLVFILAAFTPYAFYALVVLGANMRGRTVPSFGETMARLLCRKSAPNSARQLDEIAENTRRILELLGERAAAPEPPADAAREAPAEEPPATGDADGMGRSTAWADRRRSDRGKEARGTGYAGPDPGKTYAPGTGSRATDRPGFSDELRAALRRLKLKENELPDIASLTRAYRGAVKSAHPDAGGSQENFLAIKGAYDVILQEVGARKKKAGAPS